MKEFLSKWIIVGCGKAGSVEEEEKVKKEDLPMMLTVLAWLWLPGWQDSQPLLMCTCVFNVAVISINKKERQKKWWWVVDHRATPPHMLFLLLEDLPSRHHRTNSRIDGDHQSLLMSRIYLNLSHLSVWIRHTLTIFRNLEIDTKQYQIEIGLPYKGNQNIITWKQSMSSKGSWMPSSVCSSSLPLM